MRGSQGARDGRGEGQQRVRCGLVACMGGFKNQVRGPNPAADMAGDATSGTLTPEQGGEVHPQSGARQAGARTEEEEEYAAPTLEQVQQAGHALLLQLLLLLLPLLLRGGLLAPAPTRPCEG